MFVSIDLDTKRGILHKHENKNVVADMMRIELPVGMLYDIRTSDFLAHATIDEMRELWKATSGSYPLSQDPATLRGLIRGHAQGMPCIAVDAAHVAEQASKIKSNDHNVYAYVPGRDVKLTKAYVAPVETVAVTTGEPRQRMSGAKDVIWAKADEMWGAAGKPTDKAVVLKLRKAVMDALEADGVNRNSASNELGNWQKARI